ncbi:NAD-dependent succinate-semialdehyde dehydrogenase [Candidatus Parcubacteria bacterium]|jgi:succinate-semialdehyde dehydrogenase / glutarate-semialdehyde dehydrogenase|nr:NAD-dependent succinate-semialdehyde dehydrogenase [Candidatus Parcubacteria bacterium]MBT3948601.1 NAD-dependent succinate-semialdehyde dehydrogenase [Candidatus Parcubacteria bacterium]
MSLVSHNPATGEDIESFDELTDEQIEKKLAMAQDAFVSWGKLDFDDRKEKMLKLAKILKEKKYELGKLATLEMGKPITQAVGEVEKSAWVCEYYAEHAEDILQNEIIKTDYKESYVQFDPLGTILAVMPWNYPFWQVFRFLAPALMAGNVGLLKHASNVPQCALAIEEMVLEAGFPEGVFQTLLIGSSKVEQIVVDDRIKAVTLTGSEYAGSQVASQAGKHLKKAVLELGGSDPFIVLADANIPQACEVAVNARLQNAGQSCISAKRFIVAQEKYDEFVGIYKERYEQIAIGDPMDEATQLGPLVNRQALEEIDEKVQKSIEMGAEVVHGAKRIEGAGYFYEPTILGNVTKGMPVYDTEIFGPASAIIKVSSTEEAIQVANDTPYGLGSSLWTSDIELAKKLSKEIEAGAVFINGMTKSDPRLPFGGIKKSGYGRELSDYGIKEFVNIKTVVIE